MRHLVEELLQDIGPGVSSRITAALVKRGVSPDAARQQASRARGNVRRLSGLTLPKREKFLYLESQFGKHPYFEALSRDLDATNSVYGAALHGLIARGGIVPKPCFDVIAGAPRQTKGSGQRGGGPPADGSGAPCSDLHHSKGMAIASFLMATAHSAPETYRL
jgi:hypothetical protein